MDWKSLGIIIGVLVVWIGLTRWVLPWCGIKTCCSAKQCQIAPELPDTDHEPGPETKSDAS